LDLKLKVLLIMPDVNEKNYVMNYGLMHVSSYLKKKGYNVQCLNMNHYTQSSLIECIEKTTFDVVGTGGLFVHYAIFKALIETIRHYSPKSKIILGGGIASTEFEFILNNLEPDFLVVGEGERTADLLLKAIENGTDYNNVTGICFKENNRIIETNPTPLIENLDEMPFPDYEGFEYGYYLDNHYKVIHRLQNVLDDNCRMGYVISSRDCMLKCTFCFRIIGHVGKKRGYRLRKLEMVSDEIKFLIRNYGINTIEFLDDMLAVDRQRIDDICKLMSSLNLKWSCQLRVSVVDEKLLMKMKESGCYCVSYGFESGSLKVLKSMRKGIKPDQIYRAIRYTQKAKIDVQGNFIFGDPAETRETVKETIRFTRKFKSTILGYGFVMPLPGSQIYHDAVKKGLIKNKAAFYSSYPDGPASVNLTSLSQLRYKHMRYMVHSNAAYRMKNAMGKIVKVEKTGPHKYNTDIICPFCHKVNRFSVEFNPTVNDYATSDFIVCGNCYRRIAYNSLKYADSNNVINAIKYCGKYYFYQMTASSYFFFVLCFVINYIRKIITASLKNGNIKVQYSSPDVTNHK